MRLRDAEAFLANRSARPDPIAEFNFVTGRYAIAGRGRLAFADAIGFSRASEAYRVNASRLYELVAVDQPRWEYDRATGALLGIGWEDEATDLSGSVFTTGIAATLTVNALTGPDGLASGTKVVPASGTSTHGTFGATGLSVVSGLPYTFAGSFTGPDFSFLRAYFNAGRFPDDARSAIANIVSGVLGAVNTSTRARIVAAPAGAPGWWDFEMTAEANSSGVVSDCGFHLTTSAGSTSGSVSGNGARSYGMWRPRLVQAARSGHPLPPSGYRAPEAMILKGVPPGTYEVMAFGQGRGGVLTLLVDESDPGIELPSRLPGELSIIERIEVYQTGKIRRTFRSTKLPDAIPARQLRFRADTGETMGDGADLASVTGGTGISAAQSTVAKRPTKVVVGGKGLWRTTAAAASAMPVSGAPALTSPTVFSWAWNFRPGKDGRGVVWGAARQAGPAALGVDTGFTPLVLSTLALLAKGTASVDGAAGLSQLVYVRQDNRHFLMLNGEIVPLDSDLLANLTAATSRILFCDADGTNHFDGWTREVSVWDLALTEAQALAVTAEMAADTRDVIFAGADNLTAGAAFEDRFTAGFYLSGNFPSFLEVYAAGDTTFSTVLATTPAIAPQVMPADDVTFYYAKHTPTGLSANTAYRYLPVVNGQRDPAVYGMGRTSPKLGVGTAHAFIYTSCWNPTYKTTKMAPADVIVAQAPDGTFLLGDNGYTDDATPTVAAKRKAQFWARSNVSLKRVRAGGIVFVIVDDHCLTPNDWELGKILGGQPGVVMAQAAIQAWTETECHYPLWDPLKRCLAYHFDWGTHRVIVLDTRFLRQFTGIAVPTIMGRGLGSFDMEAAFLANLAAMPAAIRTFQVVFPTTYPNGDWLNCPDEQRVIEEAIAGHRCNADAMTGDGHYRWVDDGQFKVSPILRIPRAMASPTWHTAVQATAADGTPRPEHRWNGAATNNFASRQFIRQERAADGSFVHRCYTGTKAKPSPVLSVTASVADAAPTLTVLAEARTVRPGRGVQVERTWIGPYGVPAGVDALAVSYSLPGVGSGTLRYGPNLRMAETIALPEEGDFTLTLSSPKQAGADRAALLPATSFAITVADDAPLKSFLKAGASGAIASRRAIYRALYYGLKDDGVLALLDDLKILAADDADLATTNLVAPSLYKATMTGGLTLQPGAGMASDGTGYLTTGYDPAAGGTLAKQDSNAFLVWQVAGDPTNAWAMGNGDFAVRPQSPSGLLEWRDASVTVATLPIGTPLGRTLVSRTGATSVGLYRDGALVGTHGRASSPITSGSPWTVFRAAQETSGVARTLAVVAAGAGLTAAQVASLDQRVLAAVNALRALNSTK